MNIALISGKVHKAMSPGAAKSSAMPLYYKLVGRSF